MKYDHMPKVAVMAILTTTCASTTAQLKHLQDIQGQIKIMGNEPPQGMVKAMDALDEAVEAMNEAVITMGLEVWRSISES